MADIKPQVQENKMGYMPVPRLLFTMSLPMIISMLIQAFYNVVDSYFVAKISEKALSAVSLAFPVQNLMIAVASGTGVGVNALLSRSLGEKNYEQADKAANTCIILTVCSYLVFMLVGIFGSRPYFAVQTSDPEILQYGYDYMFIVCTFSIGVFMQVAMERLLQSTGRTIYNMITQSTGAILNIIFDPILIFGLFGFPKIGMAGAAIATVFGQMVAMVLGILFNMKRNPEIHLNLQQMLHPELPVIKAIYAVGIPSILMMAIGSVMNFGMNKILLMFTSTATAVFGVYFKLQSMFFMPLFGLNNGMVPIVAFNYGAKNRSRIIQTIKLSCVAAFCFMLIGFTLFQVFPAQLLGLFEASDNMLSIGVKALRTICWSYLAAGFCIVIGSVFQALGNGTYTLISSICRQLLVLLPSAFILAELGGLDAVWWAFPIAEVMSFAVSMFFFRKIYRKKIAVL